MMPLSRPEHLMSRVKYVPCSSYFEHREKYDNIYFSSYNMKTHIQKTEAFVPVSE